MIKLDYFELLQLQLILDMTRSNMSMGDIRRHASITNKVRDQISKIESVK